MDTSLHAGVLAALTVVGGIDNRPRIGGVVLSDSIEGPATVCKFLLPNKVLVQCHESSNVKKISVGHCRTGPKVPFAMERLPVTEAILDTWANLLCK